MASVYRLHKPYVLASLPRPLDHTDGRIQAREVYGQRGLQKKRRAELAVGIDGETASIYDVSALSRHYHRAVLIFAAGSRIETYNIVPDPASRIVHVPPLLHSSPPL
jgi:hypothetical protein